MNTRHPDDYIAEKDERLLGSAAVVSFGNHNSASRRVMVANHTNQRPTLDYPEARVVQNGTDIEFGKTTFKAVIPVDCRIIDIIPRYAPHPTHDRRPFISERIVVWQAMGTMEIGHTSVPYHHSTHQYFGFKYVETEAMRELAIDKHVHAGTVLADSPSVLPTGEYATGVSLNTVICSHPDLAEDPYIISESATEKLTYRLLEDITFSYGSTKIPRNLYGEKGEYRAFPELGDSVRLDGLLASLFSYDSEVSPVLLSTKQLQRPNLITDERYHVERNWAKVVDIKVVKNETSKILIPSEACSQAEKYSRAHIEYYKRIRDLEQTLRRNSKRLNGVDSIVLTDDFHRLCVEAYVMTHNSSVEEMGRKSTMGKIRKAYRKVPLEPYTVTITVETIMKPGKGHKLTGENGEKGVIGAVWPDSKMPRDEFGRVAELMAEDGSTVSRVNLGRPIGYYVASSARDLTDSLCEKLGYTGRTSRDALNFVANLRRDNFSSFSRVKDELLRYYEILSPSQFRQYQNVSVAGWEIHMASILNGEIRLKIPADNNRDTGEMIKQLEQEYKPLYGKIYWPQDDGSMVQSEENVRINYAYVFPLDKIATDGSSVNMAPLQAHNVIAPHSKLAKHLFPIRKASVRSLGEGEHPVIAGISPEGFAELMDINNNPETSKILVDAILRAPRPTDIENPIDRNKNPLGGSRPIQILNSILASSGVRLRYGKEEEFDKGETT